MSDQRRLPYQPALDGLRAVAVALVLVFHAGYPWMSGGYIGVSMFFTLSGYLITSLLLAEHDRTGGLALPGFYARRMKRLLPASLLCLIAVIVGSQYGAFAEVSGLRRDVLGSLLQVENWVKLLGSSSYADLTSASLGRVGPLEHYWSLAVEEQFYWLWPVVMLVILRLVRRPARRAATLATLAVAGVAAAFLIAAVWGANAAYWATPARLGEILVGAALAGLLHVVRRVPTWTRWTGLPAVAVIAWAAITWPSADGPAYHGWLAMLALATAALILALQTPSVLRTALSWRPLVWIGTVSYGIYLFHWPVYAWLTDSSLGWSRTTLFAVEVAITMAVTTASFYLLERPVRRWSPINRVPLAFGLLASASLALVAVVVIAPPAGRHLANAATALQPVSQPLVSLAVAAPTSSGAAVVPGPPSLSLPVSSPVPSPVPSPAPSSTAGSADAPAPTPVPTSTLPALTRPVRILIIGDSTAEATADGLIQWAGEHPTVAQVTGDAAPGCGFLIDGEVPTDGKIQWKANCVKVLDHQLPADIARLKPDVVMLMVTLRDVEDRNFTGVAGLQTPFDPPFRERLDTAYAKIAQRLLATGVSHLVWALAPYPRVPWAGDQAKMKDPARYAVQADVIRSVAAEHPGAVAVVDLDSWLNGQGKQGDLSIRPDGLHFTPDAALWLASTYLGPALVTASLGGSPGASPSVSRVNADASSSTTTSSP